MNEDFLNHKGTDCIVKPIICQEGYCSECQILLDWRKQERTGKEWASPRWLGGSKLSILRRQIRTKRDAAFAEVCCGSREHKLQSQSMVNAYDVVLKLIRGII